MVQIRQFLKRGKERDRVKTDRVVIIRENSRRLRGFVTIQTFRNGVKIRERTEEENLIMLGTNTGISLILQRLIGTNTYSLNITHADIGTGTNAPAVSNTTLQTAVARAVRGAQSIASNQASMTFFYPDALLPNGTYREFGTFVDGAIGINTGQIFNRLLFGAPYVKATGEDTTIKVRFTIT